MLGDNLSDFCIDVPEIIQMVARIEDPTSRDQMTRMVQGYLAMAHYGFDSKPGAKYSWPFLQEEVTKATTNDPYAYVGWMPATK